MFVCLCLVTYEMWTTIYSICVPCPAVDPDALFSKLVVFISCCKNLFCKNIKSQNIQLLVHDISYHDTLQTSNTVTDTNCESG